VVKLCATSFFASPREKTCRSVDNSLLHVVTNYNIGRRRLPIACRCLPYVRWRTVILSTVSKKRHGLHIRFGIGCPMETNNPKTRHITPHRAWAHLRADPVTELSTAEHDHIFECERCLSLLILCLRSEKFASVLKALDNDLEERRSA